MQPGSADLDYKRHSCFRRYFADLVFPLDFDSKPRFQPPVTAIQASFGRPVYTFLMGPSILFNRCFARPSIRQQFLLFFAGEVAIVRLLAVASVLIWSFDQVVISSFLKDISVFWLLN
jgi:hypothetical protein